MNHPYVDAHSEEAVIHRFYSDGYIVIPDAISPDICQALRAEIDHVDNQNDSERTYRKGVTVHHRMFEQAWHHFQLFFREPVTTLAEKIIADPVMQELGHKDFTGLDAQTTTHVIHNNAIVVQPGQDGINKWHQDDAPHFLSDLDVENMQSRFHLPVLALTANYYLTDVNEVGNGPMQVVAGSHKFGKVCPQELPEKYMATPLMGKAGTVIMFNNQLWHSGSPNTSNRTRYVSQVSYGRRFIGHMYHPFMNYKFPQHLIEFIKDDPRKMRLVGFLGHGPYG